MRKILIKTDIITDFDINVYLYRTFNKYPKQNNKIRLSKLIHSKFILCERCKKYRALQIHHIDKNKKNNNLQNVIMICKSCHRMIHNKNAKPYNWNGGCGRTHH